MRRTIVIGLVALSTGCLFGGGGDAPSNQGRDTASQPDSGQVDADRRDGADGGVESCQTGLSFCQGVCIDTERDELNCGGCGVVCDPIDAPTNATLNECAMGACQWKCVAGFEDGNDDLYDPDGDGCDQECVIGGLETICDGKDDNCNGEVDEGLSMDWLRDSDADGYTVGSLESSCFPLDGYLLADQSLGDDCNDDEARSNPGLLEVCDFPLGLINEDIDNDCNPGTEPETVRWYSDGDNDGYGVSGSFEDRCPESPQPVGTSNQDGDCDDSKNTVAPGVPEICDGENNNCDPVDTIDEGIPRAFCGEQVGVCATSGVECLEDLDRYNELAAGLDCDEADYQAHSPDFESGVEVSCDDGLDNDCDGKSDCEDSDCYANTGCQMLLLRTHTSYQVDQVSSTTCQAALAATTIAGQAYTWRTLLRTNNQSNIKSVVPTDKPIFNSRASSRQMVAEPGQLWSGTLMNSINYGPDGAGGGGATITYTGFSATGAARANCAGWTSTSNAVSYTFGDHGTTNGNWALTGAARPCDGFNAGRLYCLGIPQ